jgi:hypothetical protein
MSVADVQAQFDDAMDALYHPHDPAQANQFIQSHMVPPLSDNETRLLVVEKLLGVSYLNTYTREEKERERVCVCVFSLYLCMFSSVCFSSSSLFLSRVVFCVFHLSLSRVRVFYVFYVRLSHAYVFFVCSLCVLCVCSMCVFFVKCVSSRVCVLSLLHVCVCVCFFLHAIFLERSSPGAGGTK